MFIRKMDYTGVLVCPHTVLLLLTVFLLAPRLSLGFVDIDSGSHNYNVEVNPSTGENSDGLVDSAGPHQQEFCYEGSSEVGCRQDGRSDGEDGPTARRHVGGAAAGGETGKVQWDERGYVTFCQRVGNFGNQMEVFLGMMAFAKALDRTLIIPHFNWITFRERRVHRYVEFSELFQISPLLQYHRVVTMDVFLKVLAPRYWPPGQRRGYLYQFMPDDTDCNKAGCWGDLDPSIEFDECFLHKLNTFRTDIADENSILVARHIWNSKFPVEEHPVITIDKATPAFPINPGNRKIQEFVKWNEHFMSIGRSYINATFGSNTWVGLHLRNGGDWVKACTPEMLETNTFIMASPQCHEKELGAVSQDMCLPSVAHMLELTLKVVKDVNAKHLFIATDKHPHLEEFRKVLSPIGVSVHHLNPDTSQVDLVILGEADYFIGTCPSSFTSFVKRSRDATGKPSIFWGQEYSGF
ncbi:GDP-fucose protein O-fucosyltransferase 1-like [Asterias rubens]|uniref:GDP-fucose protein O-fucosyltransferase 1-like n=1 Tax=Asterias rubens TaxID=7604 RepID=UPI001454EE09|nr:GDP-fucose protein O-fucosyltransferase 1-like [Asterias rubens]